MRGDELQTFKNKNSPIRENLEENFSVLFGKYVKPHPVAKTKDILQKTVFNSSYQNLATSLDELQRLTKYAFEIAAHAIIQQFIFPKMPRQPKKLINRAHLENGSYEQIVLHLERELVLSSLEASDELKVNRASQLDTKTFKESEPTCHQCNEPGNYKNQWRQLSKQEEQDADIKNSSGKNDGAPTNCNSNTSNNKCNYNNKTDRKPRSVYTPCVKNVAKWTNAQKGYFGVNAANRPPPRKSRPAAWSQAQRTDPQITTEKMSRLKRNI